MTIGNKNARKIIAHGLPHAGFSHRRSHISYYLICRARTSIQQKLPPQLQEKLENFTVNMKELREIYKFENTMVINMDETPMYFDMPSSHTVHKKGCREVWIRSTGAEKRRLTVILACTASGDVLPPMVIFKGKRALKNLRFPPGVVRVVVEVQKKGWNDSSFTKVWIQKILCQYTKKQHALLVWDTFSGHMTPDVAEMLRKNNIAVTVIPGGCTSKIQPLDVCRRSLRFGAPTQSDRHGSHVQLLGFEATPSLISHLVHLHCRRGPTYLFDDHIHIHVAT